MMKRVRTIVLLSLMAFFAGLMPSASVISFAGADSTGNSAPEGNDSSEKKPHLNSFDAPGRLALNLRDFVRNVIEKNEQIQFQNAEWAVSKEAVKGAKSIFEPVFLGTYQIQDDKHKTTAQERASQGFYQSPEFWEDRYSQQLAIEELVPTGGRIRLNYSYNDFSNSLQEKEGKDKEKQTVVGVSFTQPLLKNAGIKPTMAAIHVAEADRDIAFQNYRVQTMRVVSEAISSYWDLYLARKKLQMRLDSERSAEEVLRDNTVRVKTGKMAETEVLEAKAALAMRKSRVSEAKQAIVAVMNNVRTFLSSSFAVAHAEIEPVAEPYIDDVPRNFADSLERALKFRGEYLSSRKKIEREDIRLAFAKNQSWPQVDLKGSYNLNGLTDKYGNPFNDAKENDHPSWSVGIEFRIPLGGDKKTISELETTKHRKRQALLELKAVEVALANAVDTALRNLDSAREQVRQQAGIVALNSQLLKTELQRFQAGKSNSRALLEREENLNAAREGEADSYIKYMKAVYQLDLAEGLLLARQGVDFMEAEVK